VQNKTLLCKLVSTKITVMEKHLNVVAALQIGLSVLGLLGAGIASIVLHLVGNFAGEPEAELVLSIIANVVMVIVAVLAIPGIVAGLGLFKRKEWARILTLILAVLDLARFPIGTAIGIYSIWVLAQNETVALFKTTES
jgi:hypothetical protein